ncbi:pyridoxamine 5'-phosphate oxidase family protein [uncultured Fretibacterium sp.]|uniref:pyridoxamine 5'-phosphate oxidase family protein n=1 Tax=uncultured Fretibacterium sp. TaxID=1678694 RepID=UPI00261E3F8F|nr:pyridoxamine 5'-phosphate oxidase family protein [uncultured Fretibacterium sp.]
MRRKDREVTDLGAIGRIIGDCKVLRLGMVDEGRPYVVPMNFGFDLRDGVLELYCHSAPEGRKVEVLRRKPEVCFEMDCGHRLVEAEAACGYGFAYSSVIGEGTVGFIEDHEEKLRALLRIMEHQTGRSDFSIPDAALRGVLVFGVAVGSFTAKQRLLPQRP